MQITNKGICYVVSPLILMRLLSSYRMVIEAELPVGDAWRFKSLGRFRDAFFLRSHEEIPVNWLRSARGGKWVVEIYGRSPHKSYPEVTIFFQGPSWIASDCVSHHFSQPMIKDEEDP